MGQESKCKDYPDEYEDEEVSQARKKEELVTPAHVEEPEVRRRSGLAAWIVDGSLGIETRSLPQARQNRHV